MVGIVFGLLVIGVVGILAGTIWAIFGAIAKKPHRGGWMAGISALIFLLGAAILYIQLQGLDKSDMDSAPPPEIPTIEEQLAEAQQLRQEQHASEENFNTLSLLNPSLASLAIEDKAEEEWPDNKNLQDEYVEEHAAALTELFALTIDEPHKDAILTNAIRQTPVTFKQILSYYTDQLEAYEWIESQTLDTEAKQQAMADSQSNWGDDYAMVRFVYTEQFPETAE